MKTVFLTQDNIAEYASCNAAFNDSTKEGKHLFSVKTFEPVGSIQDFIPFTEQTFCPVCVANMQREDREYILREDKLAAKLYKSYRKTLQ